MIICKECEHELLSTDIMVGINIDGKLMRRCRYCGTEEEVA